VLYKFEMMMMMMMVKTTYNAYQLLKTDWTKSENPHTYSLTHKCGSCRITRISFIHSENG